MSITREDIKNYLRTFAYNPSELIEREGLDMSEYRAQGVIEMMNNHEEHVQAHTIAVNRWLMRSDIAYLKKIKKNKGHLRRHKNRMVWKWKKDRLDDLLLEEFKFYSI